MKDVSIFTLNLGLSYGLAINTGSQELNPSITEVKIEFIIHSILNGPIDIDFPKPIEASIWNHTGTLIESDEVKRWFAYNAEIEIGLSKNRQKVKVTLSILPFYRETVEVDLSRFSQHDYVIGE